MGLVDRAVLMSRGPILEGLERMLNCLDDDYALARRHSRNVDKQRRRLLAEKCERRADDIESEWTTRWYSTLSDAEAASYVAKLRAWAERLREQC
jgi:hypothetical protein